MAYNIEEMKNILFVLVFGLLLAGCAKEPEYINRSFKNGNSISVGVNRGMRIEDWNCTGSCSGHWAGYEWAESKGIVDPLDCGGNSASFIEGCITYANGN